MPSVSASMVFELDTSHLIPVKRKCWYTNKKMKPGVSTYRKQKAIYVKIIHCR